MKLSLREFEEIAYRVRVIYDAKGYLYLFHARKGNETLAFVGKTRARLAPNLALNLFLTRLRDQEQPTLPANTPIPALPYQETEIWLSLGFARSLGLLQDHSINELVAQEWVTHKRD